MKTLKKLQQGNISSVDFVVIFKYKHCTTNKLNFGIVLNTT